MPSDHGGATGPVVLVVALNPAIDVTHEVRGVRLGATNRAAVVRSRAGGKALNVARTLHALGRRVQVLGIGTTATGSVLEADLADAGFACWWERVDGPTRRTFTVVDVSGAVDGAGGPGSTATTFTEPGPVVDGEAWDRLLRRFEAMLPVDAVVLSGSLPPGLPAHAYATLVEVARGQAACVAVDTDGPGFAPAVAAGPSLVKPNRDELVAAGFGPGGDGAGDPRWALAAATELRRRGAGAVVASLGPNGLVAVSDRGRWSAVAPEVSGGNPTGAGDAVVAALVAGSLDGLPWPDRLRQAAALGAASVAEPVAGAFDRDLVADLSARTVVEAR